MTGPELLDRLERLVNEARCMVRDERALDLAVDALPVDAITHLRALLSERDWYKAAARNLDKEPQR